MSRKRKRKPVWRPPELTEDQILAWADAYHQRSGRWPSRRFGRTVIPGTGGERWSAINSALSRGSRGLAGGSSLARLLAEHRGFRNRKGLPSLAVEQILAWADSYHERTGLWPKHDTSPRTIPESHGESWHGVDDYLRRGLRGLPGGSSLVRLIAEKRGVRNIKNLPPLTEEQILAWADAYYSENGRWPRQKNWYELIAGSSGETWLGMEQALKLGLRSLPGGTTLAKLLSGRRGVRNVGNLPKLTEQQILAWAEDYRSRHGVWPTCRCPAQIIEGSPDEKWFNVDQALRKGLRGLPGGSSLAILVRRARIR